MSKANSKETSLKSSPTYRDQLLTIGDLELFRNNLLAEIKDAFKASSSQSVKQWLRSSEVRKMLGVSPGTLQNLRINRRLSYTKIGGIVFYKHEDIIKLMDENCIVKREKNG